MRLNMTVILMNSQLRTTVAVADLGPSRHVMGDAMVANSGRFHMLSSGLDEDLIPSLVALHAPRVKGSAIPATQVSRGVEGIYREL